MKVFAIGDLHLSLLAPFQAGSPVCSYKPMDVFGLAWQDYLEKLYLNWRRRVSPEDAVLVPGDISWGMNLADCQYDWDFLSRLPGKIYISRGNHDYWWQGISKVRESLPKNVLPLNHDSALIGGKAVCATRGWILPGMSEWKSDDEVVYKRELLRLEMALEEGKKSGLPLVVMLHFMPCYRTGEPGGFTELMEKYAVEMCIYGHLHGEDCKNAVLGHSWGFELINVSSDRLGFEPYLLWETK